MKWLRKLVMAAAARQVEQERRAAEACDCGCDCEEDDDQPGVGAAPWRIPGAFQLPPDAHNGYGTLPDFTLHESIVVMECDDPDWCYSAPTVSGIDWD